MSKNKKPIYKRAWFWAVAVIVVVGTSGGADTDNSKETNSGNVESVQEVSQSNSENAVAENETKNIENILGTIVSNWIVHEYGELMSEEMGNIHASNLGNKLDFFSANGLYYTLSDMMQLVYNQLSKTKKKKRLVKLGIKWQTQDFSKNIPDNLAGIDRWNYLVNTSLSNIK